MTRNTPVLVTPKVLPRDRAGGVAVVVVTSLVFISAIMAKRAVESSAQPARLLSDVLIGLTRPGDVSSVTATAPATVAEVLAAVGDELQPGQPLVRLDQTEALRAMAPLEIDVERATREVAERERAVAWAEHEMLRLTADAADSTARLAVAAREAQQIPVRQAKDSPARAQLACEQAELKARRMQQLAANGLVPRQSVEEAQFEARIAAEDLANARQAADAARRVEAAESAQARARRDLALADQRQQLADRQAGLGLARLGLKQSRLKHEAARLVTADAFVRATSAGAVVELPVHAGDRLFSGAVVARIAPLDPVIIDVDVPPELVNAIHVGDVAEVEVPNGRLTRREARLRSVAPLPGFDGHFTVHLTLPNPDHLRLAGQPAQVRFSTDRARGRP